MLIDILNEIVLQPAPPVMNGSVPVSKSVPTPICYFYDAATHSEDAIIDSLPP